MVVGHLLKYVRDNRVPDPITIMYADKTTVTFDMLTKIQVTQKSITTEYDHLKDIPRHLTVADNVAISTKWKNLPPELENSVSIPPAVLLEFYKDGTKVSNIKEYIRFLDIISNKAITNKTAESLINMSLVYKESKQGRFEKTFAIEDPAKLKIFKFYYAILKLARYLELEKTDLTHGVSENQHGIVTDTTTIPFLSDFVQHHFGNPSAISDPQTVNSDFQKRVSRRGLEALFPRLTFLSPDKTINREEFIKYLKQCKHELMTKLGPEYKDMGLSEAKVVAVGKAHELATAYDAIEKLNAKYVRGYRRDYIDRRDPKEKIVPIKKEKVVPVKKEKIVRAKVIQKSKKDPKAKTQKGSVWVPAGESIKILGTTRALYHDKSGIISEKRVKMFVQVDGKKKASYVRPPK